MSDEPKHDEPSASEQPTPPAIVVAPKSLPPEMIMKSDIIPMHKDDIERVLMDKLPGHIADVSGGGQIPGCRIIEFRDDSSKIDGLPDEHSQYLQTKFANRWFSARAVEKINIFFQAFANYMMRSHHVRERSIVVLYTSMLNEADTGDLQLVSDRIRAEINKLRAERREAEEKAEEQRMVRDRAINEIGTKALEHNLFGKLDELSKTNKRLEEENKKLKASVELKKKKK